MENESEVLKVKNHSEEQLNVICLTCMKIIKSKKFNILTIPFLVRKIEYVTSLQIELTEAVPKNLCKKCFDNINKANDFKLMCIESYSKLRKIIVINKNEFEQKEAECEELTELKELENIDNIVSLENEELNDCSTSPNNLGEEIQPNKYDNEDSTRDLDQLNENSDSNKSEPKRHDDQKVVKNVFRCNECPKRFFKESCFEAHQRVHLGLKPFACPHCEKVFSKSSGLGVHIKNIHGNGEDVFICNQPGCDKFYKRKQTLRWHCRTVHENNMRISETKLFICEVCGSSFKNKSSLDKHRFKHTGEDLPFQCTDCGKRYMTKHKLKEHTMRHAGIKNFVCPHCGMRKTTRNELKTHINYHTKEKQYPCKFCDLIFNSSGNLGRHVRIVHEGIKEFACKFCDRKFGKAETCRHHEMTHTGEKPHICSICNKRFIQLIALRVHVKRHKNRMNLEKSKLSSNAEEINACKQKDAT